MFFLSNILVDLSLQHYAFMPKSKQPLIKPSQKLRTGYNLGMEIRQKQNLNARLLAIGDIHGCLEQLQSLLLQVNPTAQDQVVFLGDYVDRGPASAGVIELLIEFGKKFPGTVFLRGNHEQMLIDYLAGKDPGMFLLNGGTNTLNSYEKMGLWPIPDSHIDFLSRLQNYALIDEYIFVHAGLRPGIVLEQQSALDMLWIRRDFIDSDFDWGKTVVYGHTPLSEPFFSATRIGLDTGCVYGRQLTCCEIKTRTVWQA
jgi:serine/threonine protein phosphatase 1